MVRLADAVVRTAEIKPAYFPHTENAKKELNDEIYMAPPEFSFMDSAAEGERRTNFVR